MVAPGADETASRPTGNIGAVVLGGAHGGLAVVRSLGRRGIPVVLVSNDNLIAKSSRYTKLHFSWPGPDDPGAEAWLQDLARRHQLQGWVLFPAADADARLVSLRHAELSKTYRLTTQPWDVTRWAFDKRLTYERAASVGVHVPWSHYPAGRQDVAALECQFPLILKPTVNEHRNDFTASKAWRVDDRASLLARYDQAAALVGDQAIVLQEFIPGSGSSQFSYAAVWDRGQPVASLVAQRARQFPIDFGYTSTFVQTVERPEVEEAACRLLRSLNYDGLVEVEFKYDKRNDRYKILDINVRAWTWIALGGIAGTDFPHLMWRLARGETPEKSRGMTGAGWMHLSRDALAACHEISAGSMTALDYFGSFRGPLTYAAYAKDDPLPGLIDLPLVSWRVLTRRLPLLMREASKRRLFKPPVAGKAL